MIRNRNILSYKTVSFVIFLHQIDGIFSWTLHDYTVCFHCLTDKMKATFVVKIIVFANHLLVVGGSLIALHRQKCSYQLYHSCMKLLGQSLKCGRFFICSMDLSIWILRDAILLVSSNSRSLNCPDSIMNGGTLTFSFTPLNASISWILNPLSTIMTSPCCTFSIRPDFWVSFLSEMLPPYRVETNEMPPFSTIPNKVFRLLLFCMKEKLLVGQLGCLAFQCMSL